MSGDKIAARALIAALALCVLAAALATGGAAASRDHAAPVEWPSLSIPGGTMPSAAGAITDTVAAMLASELLLINEQHTVELPVVFR